MTQALAEPSTSSESPPQPRRRWTQTAGPWLGSIAIHAALIGVGILATKAVQQIARPVRQEQVIIPEATLAPNGEAGGIPNPGAGDDPSRSVAQAIDPGVAASDGQAEREGRSLTADLASAGASDAEADVIGQGSRASIGLGNGSGILRGDSGSGTGDGGDLAPFGRPGGGGIGPKAPFMGQGGNAVRVVYVCDASGSMLGLKWTILKEELRRSIDGLKPIQRFDVIFFKDGKFFALDNSELVVANRDNLKRAATFIEEASTGPSSDPLAALKLAIRLKPQLMYFLSDGEINAEVEPAVQQLVAQAIRENAELRIVSLLLTAPASDDLPVSRRREADADRERARRSLEAFATASKGRFRVVDTSELRRGR
jgi:hypothetical protein